MKKIYLLLALLLSSVGTVHALDAFTITDIRVEGLQRITEGTVFNYLPVEIGDVLTPGMAKIAIRELYRTGFFDDIKLAREGDILVIAVSERASIARIVLTGNKAIKSEDLLSALSDIGLAEGEIFNRVELDRMQQELVKQYYSQGKYAVQVETNVLQMERNRVRVSIVIDEGDNAKIKHINIVGNTLFTDEELREGFESDIPPGWVFWSKDDQYSREKLSGDLEKLRSYYQDRGYVDFNVESTQVSISLDKSSIYITANVREGELFNIGETTITGDLVVEESSLRRLIYTNTGQVFSRARMEASIESITAVLANIGYAFANVAPNPTINRDDHTVDINYYIDPGKRVYIRRVLFAGNTGTKDEVLRREMRQFEGAWFSQAAIDRSKIRLQRLTYFEEVNVETPAVPGTDDQVDVIVTVEERPSGSFSAGLGFSQIQGLILSFSINQDNFLGSGKRVGLGVSSSDILKQVDISYNNPYWSDDGVSRGFFLRYREFDQGAANISSFTTSEGALGVNFGVPVSEVDFITAGLSARKTDINIGNAVFEFEDLNGDCVNDANMNGICNEIVLVPGTGDPLANSLDHNGDGVLDSSEREVETLQLDLAWSRDSRDHFLNPNRGSVQRVGFEASLPGSSRDYYKIFYRYAKYIPFWRSLVFSFHGDVGYGDVYDNYDDELLAALTASGRLPGPPQIIAGDCSINDVVTLDVGLPFYEHFYGGGVRDIRGFEDNTLGPKDQFCRSMGGDLKVSGGLELAFPTPFLGGRGGTRLALFLDIGNVYENFDTFDSSTLRASAGISLTWQAPVGPIIINFAVPLREEPGDRVEELQFSFGSTF